VNIFKKKINVKLKTSNVNVKHLDLIIKKKIIQRKYLKSIKNF